MQSSICRRIVGFAPVLCISLLTTAAWAQQAQGTRQALDTVDSFNPTSIIEMQFHDPDRTQDFINLGLTGTSNSACQLTALDGMFCLDQGKFIKHWPEIDEPATSVNEFSCAHAALGLAATNPCTTMTMNQSGAFLLAGKKANNKYNLIKVVAKTGSNCPTGWSALSGTPYCARVLYADRSELLDLVSIAGEEAAKFRPCPTCSPQSGILAVEGKSIVFFRDPNPTSAPPIEVADAQTLGLIGNEKVLSAALLQVPNGGATDSYAVATTDNGRVLAKKTNGAGGAFVAFNIPAEREQSTAQCSTATQNYGIRTSSKSGKTYISDRQFCYVKSLDTDVSLLNELVGFDEDQTLSTTGSAGTFPPTNTTLAPGINIDLGECAGTCPYLKNQDGDVLASFIGVQLNTGSEDSATAFQILDVPDCRQKFNPAFPPDMKTLCDAHPDAVVDPDNVGHPAAQLMNVTKVLPFDVLEIINSSGNLPGGLPDLLISRQYIATSRTDFLFDLFLYITQPGVHFQGNFVAEYDVPKLEGGPETDRCEPDPDNLIAMDAVTNVSELYVSTDIDGDNVGDYVDTLTNNGCRNPTRTFQKGISAVSYNLAPNPDTYGFTIVSPSVKTVTEGNDAVFVRLAQSLLDDLQFVLNELACKNFDVGSGQPPLSSSVCSSLRSKLESAEIKYNKCYLAAFSPKNSTTDENCNAGNTQLNNFLAAIPATTPTRDIANRVADVRGRATILLNLINTRTIPSMTLAGFCREEDPNPTTCPDPWQ
jgi:hypothetical protein